MRLRSTIAAFALASALTPCIAHAQPVSEGDKAAARQLVTDGFAALDRRDYVTASDLFKRADALIHAPTVLLGLARAQAALGKLVSAQDAYNRLVHLTLPPDASAAFVKAIEDGTAELAALQPRVPALIIQVKGADAPTVTLDGTVEPAAVVGVRRPVDPGKHVITAVARGFLKAQGEATVAEGKVETITLTLVPAPPGSPEAAAAAAAGPDTGGSDGSTRRTVGWAILGVGGASLVAGAVLMVVDHSKYTTLLAKCPDGHCPVSSQSTLQGDVNSYKTMGGAAVGTLVAGGALAAAGLVVALTAPKGNAPSTALAPVVGPGFVGAGMSGRF